MAMRASMALTRPEIQGQTARWIPMWNIDRLFSNFLFPPTISIQELLRLNIAWKPGLAGNDG